MRRKCREAKYGDIEKFRTKLGPVRNLQEQQVSQTQFSTDRKDLLWFFRNIAFNHQALGNSVERSPHGCLLSKEGPGVTLNQKAKQVSQHLKDDSTFYLMCNPDLNGVLKKPNTCMLTPLKNSVKIKHRKGISEQAGIGGKKRSLYLGCPMIPHPTPDPLPLAFQVLLYWFTHHPDSGTEKRQVWGE